jgi:hypothetical protein
LNFEPGTVETCPHGDKAGHENLLRPRTFMWRAVRGNIGGCLLIYSFNYPVQVRDHCFGKFGIIVKKNTYPQAGFRVDGNFISVIVHTAAVVPDGFFLV